MAEHPATGPFLLDRAELYARFPAQGKALEEKLQAFHQRHKGIAPFYIVTITSTSHSGELLALTVKERQKLLGNKGDGFILTYEIDSGMFNLSMRPMIADAVKEDWKPSVIPQHEERASQGKWMQQIKKQISEEFMYAATKEFDPQRSCAAVADAWMQTFDQYMASTPPPKSNFKPLTIGAIAFLALFLLWFGFAKWLGKKRTIESMSYELPIPNTKPRLGALNSGGNATSREYK